jgi:hypothetical protein
MRTPEDSYSKRYLPIVEQSELCSYSIFPEGDMGKVRMRRHSNPPNPAFQRPLQSHLPRDPHTHHCDRPIIFYWLDQKPHSNNQQYSEKVNDF